MANEHRIPDTDIVMSWELHDAGDLEIGMGVDYKNGLVAVKYDRHVKIIMFDQTQLGQYIAALVKQYELLKVGIPPTH